MQELSLNEIKQIQLKLLDVLVDFCNQEGLRYFLAYGTLLGAIRHKGYIPWDDDIDLVLPRPDYEKLILSFNMFHSDCKIYSYEIDENYYLPFAKLSHEATCYRENTDVNFDHLGVNIDIFPLDGLKTYNKERNKSIRKLMVFRKILNLKLISHRVDRPVIKKLILKIGKAFFKHISYNKIAKTINKYAIKNNYDISDYVGCIVWNYGAKEIMHKNIYSEFINVEFEGKNYHAPLRFDEYLKKLYGEYMELPPVTKRITHHDYKVFWK